TYAGKDLWSRSLDPPAGKIRYSAEYELLEAARWRGLTWQDFDALEGDDQALIIAHYRTAQRLAAVDAWENRPKKDAHGAKRGTARRRRR
ncbi:hypothetical protein SE17_40355, partial [Kouleothrix aurantiaca]